MAGRYKVDIFKVNEDGTKDKIAKFIKLSKYNAGQVMKVAKVFNTDLKESAEAYEVDEEGNIIKRVDPNVLEMF